MRKGIFFIIVFTMMLPQAFAEALSHEALYYRCHAHLVRLRPEAGDPLLAQVKNGSKTGVDACKELLDLGTLDASGDLVHGSNPKAQKVLETFQRLHHSWIGNHSYRLNGLRQQTGTLYDYNEMALHFTNVLFRQSTNFKDLVTGNQVFNAKRIEDPSNDYFVDSTIRAGYKIPDANTDIVKWIINGNEWTPNLYVIGDFVGIKPVEDNLVPFTAGPRNAHESFGGGVLGSPSYLLLNAKSTHGQIDGGIRVYRRWSRSVINTFLCRDVPTLNAADVEADIVPSSAIAFKASSSCVRCHSTLDPLAGVVRNFKHQRASDAQGSAGPTVYIAELNVAYQQDVTDAQESPLNWLGVEVGTNGNGNDWQYGVRPPKGTFKYRDMDGNYFTKVVNNLDDFGNFLANDPNFTDLYTCMAKRYMKFFTGIDASMEPTASLPLSTTEMQHRTFVKSLGANLKSSQNLKNVLGLIFESDYYRDRKYGGL